MRLSIAPSGVEEEGREGQLCFMVDIGKGLSHYVMLGEHRTNISLNDMPMILF